jgi:vancomycin resistance protein YoaR
MSTIVVLAVAGGVCYKLGYFDKRYEITNSDGTVDKLTSEELLAELAVDVFPQGVIINGVDVSGMTQAQATEAVLANQPERPIDIDISLSLDGETYPLDLTSLPIDSNVDEVVAEAYNYLRPTGQETPEQLIAMHDAREALKTTPVEYQTAYTLNTDEISPLVHDVLDPVNCDPVEAQITGFDVENLVFEYTESQIGYVVDIDTAVADVKALLDSGTYTGTVDVSAAVTEPALTAEMIETEFGMISESSSVTAANSNRNHNIQITAEKLNGMVMQNGDSFSFNGYIGQRTSAAGYLEAGVIVNGTTEQALGGGVCQVSSMIYQSCIKANLQIDERHPHQWPSSYATAGTDAAVDWGNQDFAFTNDSGYPIAMVAYWDPATSVLTISIYGHLLPDGQYIDFVGETVSTSSAGTTYVANGSLPVGTRNQTRGAHNGVTANSYQIWYAADGTEIQRVELEPTRYATINAIVEVGTLQPDGSQAAFDAATGTVTPTVTETTPPSDVAPSDVPPSDVVPSDTAPSETAAPTETPAPTAPPETTPAPSSDVSEGGEQPQ